MTTDPATVQAPTAQALLHYAVSADPSPLQTGVDTTVTIRVRPRTPPVYCKQIVVAVPVGDGEAALFAAPPDPSLSPTTWTVGSEPSADAVGADPGWAKTVFDCSPNDNKIDYDLVLTLQGTVDDETGDTEIQIMEISDRSPHGPFLPKTATTVVSKQSPEFSLRNLSSTKPAEPAVFCTDFAKGEPIRLAWESNGTDFQVYVPGRVTAIWEGSEQFCDLGDGVTRDSTFVLVATRTGQPGGGSETLYDTLTVTVADPVLPGTLDVTGTTTLGVAHITDMEAVDAGVSGTLTVTGNAGVGGSTVLNGTTVNGTLAGNGPTTLSDTTVNGALTGNGATFLSAAAVAGTLTATGSSELQNVTVYGTLDATEGSVALLGGAGPRLLHSGTHFDGRVDSAPSDGFAIAKVNGSADATQSSFAYGGITVQGGPQFQAQGGTVGSFAKDWTHVMNVNPSTVTVPIQKGTGWSYNGYNAGGNQIESVIEIWWFPMGSG